MSRKELGDGIVLIVGSKPSNFKDWTDCEQLRFWHSTNPRKSEEVQLPRSTKLVLTTRFVGHNQTEVLKQMARKLNPPPVFRPVISTGEIIRMLHELGIQPHQKKRDTITLGSAEEIPVLESNLQLQPTPQTEKESHMASGEEITSIPTEEVREKPKRGSIKEFVSENANFSTQTTIREECLRLFALAKEAGLQTTQMSIEQCFYLLRKKKSGQNTKPARKGKQQEITEVLKQFLGLSEMVAVAIQELLEETEALRQKNRELEEKLKGIRAMMRGI